MYSGPLDDIKQLILVFLGPPIFAVILGIGLELLNPGGMIQFVIADLVLFILTILIWRKAFVCIK